MVRKVHQEITGKNIKGLKIVEESYRLIIDGHVRLQLEYLPSERADQLFVQRLECSPGNEAMESHVQTVGEAVFVGVVQPENVKRLDAAIERGSKIRERWELELCA